MLSPKVNIVLIALIAPHAGAINVKRTIELRTFMVRDANITLLWHHARAVLVNLWHYPPEK
jgi:hypothetical protein